MAEGKLGLVYIKGIIKKHENTNDSRGLYVVK